MNHLRSTLELNAGMRWIKYILIIFNLIFVLTGMLMIILGTTINSIYSDFSNFLEAKFFSPALFLITIGFIVFGISCLGCIGTIKESVCMIMVFTLFLAVVFVLEFSAGLSGYFLMGHLRQTLLLTMNELFTDYGNSNDLSSRNIIDSLQRDLRCCGMADYRDWGTIFNNPNNPNTTPYSCCVPSDLECSQIYSTGCLIQVEQIVYQSGIFLAGTAITLACMQLIGVLFSHSLAKLLRQQKSAREARRMYLREQLLNNADFYYVFDKKTPMPFSGNEKEKEILTE